MTMDVVADVHRAAHALRNHLERTVLAPHGLTWTGWVALWVLWVSGETECRQVATEVGVSRGTLTGVQQTLVAKGYVRRRMHPDDGRRVLLSLTADGEALMEKLVPEVDEAEAWLTADLERPDQLARGLRTLLRRTELR